MAGTCHKPEGFVQRSDLLQKANSLVLAAKQMERGITDNLESVSDSIDNIAERVNAIASEIAAINGKIVQVEAGSQVQNANDLRDQRDVLMNELATLVDFSSYEDENGSMTIMAGMRNLVSGETSNSLSTRTNEEGDKDLYLDGINITGNIKKGQLGGTHLGSGYYQNKLFERSAKTHCVSHSGDQHASQVRIWTRWNHRQ